MDQDSASTTRARLHRILDVIVDLPEPDRPRAVEVLCADRPDLADAVRRAVSAQEQAALERELASRLGGQRPNAAGAGSDRPHGETIGPYRLLERLGEGAFGEVFVAEQSSPVRRRVALKLLKPGMGSREVIARFEAERQVLAIMDHPHIARIFDAGSTPLGLPYFVMELVRGVPITKYCTEQRLSLRERLALLIPVCEAVQHAHQRGIIHRDLKPGNVLVTVLDGKPVPKVIDFGIAKALGPALTDATIYTQFCQFIGTPAYMSPEQMALSAVDVDTRSDVYSLGAVLYELVCGSPPFDADTLLKAGLDELRRVVRETDPPTPSTRVSGIDAGSRITLASAMQVPVDRLSGQLRDEVDWIVAKATERDRGRRYQSPLELADDLSAYLAGRAVKAGPRSRAYLARKFVRRHRVPVIAGGVIVSALGVAAVVATMGFAVVRTERNRAEDALSTARREAESRAQAEAIAVRRWDASRIGLALEIVRGGQSARGTDLLMTVPPERRGWEWRYVMTIARGTGRPAGPAGIAALTLRKERRRSLLAGQAHSYAGSLGEPPRPVGAAIGPTYVELTVPDGPRWELPTPLQPNIVAIAPDASLVALAAHGDVEVIVNRANPGELRSLGVTRRNPSRMRHQWLRGAPNRIEDLAWSADANILAASVPGASAWEWPLSDAAGEIIAPVSTTTVFTARHSVDGTRIYLGCWGITRAIDAVSLAPLWTTSHTQWYTDIVAPLRDGRVFTIAGQEHADAFLLDGASGEMLRAWSDRPVSWLEDGVSPRLIPGTPVSASASFSPSGERVVVCRADGSAGSLDTATWTWAAIDVSALSVEGAYALSCVASRNGAVLFVASSNDSGTGQAALGVLDPDASAARLIVRIPDRVAAAAWSPDGARLAVASPSGDIRLIDAADGRELWKASHPEGAVVAGVGWMRGNPDVDPASLGGRARILVSFSDGRAVWLDEQNGEPTLSTRLPHGGPLSVDPAGARVFVSGRLLLEDHADPGSSDGRVVAQRFLEWLDLGATAQEREQAVDNLSWANPAQRALAVQSIRGYGDHLALMNSNSIVALSRDEGPEVIEAAVRATELLVRRAPRSFGFASTRAWALVRSGRVQESEAAFARAEELRRGYGLGEVAEQHVTLAHIRVLQGRFAEADDLLAHAQRLLDAEPNPIVRDTIALVRRAANRE